MGGWNGSESEPVKVGGFESVDPLATNRILRTKECHLSPLHYRAEGIDKHSTNINNCRRKTKQEEGRGEANIARWVNSLFASEREQVCRL